MCMELELVFSGWCPPVCYALLLLRCTQKARENCHWQNLNNKFVIFEQSQRTERVPLPFCDNAAPHPWRLGNFPRHRLTHGANICNCLPNMHYWLQKLPKHDIINLSINFPFFNTRRHKNQDPKILTSFRMLGKIYIFDCRVMARIGIVFIFFFFCLAVTLWPTLFVQIF